MFPTRSFGSVKALSIQRSNVSFSMAGSRPSGARRKTIVARATTRLPPLAASNCPPNARSSSGSSAPFKRYCKLPEDPMLRLLNRLGYWLGHRRLEADLAEEIEFHRNMKQRELEKAGLPALEASNASRRALGNV